MIRIICLQVFVLLFVLNVFSQKTDTSSLDIISIDDETPDLSLLEIPWIGEDIDELYKTKPLFSIASDDSETSAKGWVGVNKNEIIIRVVVTDDYHINTRSSSSIWDGDAIQFGIDANGDGVGNRLKTEAYTGPNDASISFALTEDGPKAWAYYYGHPDGPGEFKNLTLNIDRNDKKQTTTYNIRFLWESFQMKPGISSCLGMVFQINDTDKGPNQKRIYWGNGAGGNLRPGLFKKLRIAPPNENFISIQTIKNKVWSSSDKAKVIVAIHTDELVNLSAGYGNLSRQITVSGFEEQPLLKRYYVEASSGNSLHKLESLYVAVKGNDIDDIQSVTPVEYSGLVLNKFNEIIDSLIQISPHPLYTRNLQSINAIITDEWNKAMTQLDEDPYHLQLLSDHIKIILDGFQKGFANWDDNPNVGKSLIFTFLSSQDRSLQFYKLSLPANFNPDKIYPLIIDLHGSGSPYPLDFFSSMFYKRELLNTDNTDAIIASPWGRGNYSYRGVAEFDVWDVMRDVKHTFNIDEERQYLCGFSMGGYGTWMLAIHAPQHWAAIAVCAGGDRGAPSVAGLALNIADIPTYLWHGDSDGTVPVTYAFEMQDALRAVGNEPEMVIVPGRGHDFRVEDRQQMYNWLLQHSRKPMTGFSYISSSINSIGRNGVEVLDIYPAATALPIIEVEISVNRVKIESQNTSRIRIIMGKGGLNLTGKVQVVWNDTEVYNGSAIQKIFTNNSQ